MLTLFYTLGFIEVFIIGFGLWDDDDVNGVIPTLFLLLGLAATELWGPFKPIVYLLHNPVQSIVVFVSYFFVGGLWSLVKWWFAEKGRVRKLKSRSYKSEDLLRYKTNPSAHKSTFLVWITYWPFSIVLTALNDPLHRLAVWVYDTFSSFYQRITDSVWS